jgi:hypothetical protein
MPSRVSETPTQLALAWEKLVKESLLWRHRKGWSAQTYVRTYNP